MGDSVSAIAMSSVSQSNKDETTLVEALKLIQAINDQSVASDMIIDVCSLFTKDFAAVHINKHKCTAFINGLIKALDFIGRLPIDDVAGLIAASFVLGQSCWVSCVSLVQLLNADRKDQVVYKFSVYLTL